MINFPNLDSQDQAAEAFRNPSTMREVLVSTDRAVNELRSVPGGIEMITSMYEQLQLPEEEAPPEDAGLPPPAADEPPPAWHTACDANAMASMMQVIWNIY